ncbi:hypothetical protein BKA65DRAFT_544383 [Rhexocercosporidium sp. MPI-PUGE-AT-0058]|nr:hypothetical protein BKA65DRAFT_544383 [Rhexocercosporidium sp. MPI-PUGE-AT-0058]
MSAFPGFDLTDVLSIRLLAQALTLYAEGHHRSSNNFAISRFNNVQRSTFRRILGHWQQDHGFERLVRQLLYHQHHNDGVVVRLAGEIQSYVEGTNSAKIAQPTLASSAAMAPLKFVEIINNSYNDYLQEIERQIVAHILANEAHNVEYHVEESDSDWETESENGDQDDEEIAMPLLHDDYEVIWNEKTMHRKAARPGLPDPSFYKIEIHLRKKAVNGVRSQESVPSIKFDYLENHKEPTWEIASKSLYKMNQWRNQIFRNYLGNKRPTRGPYLVVEQKLIIDLLRQQLEDPLKVRPAPRWGRLINAYNRLLQDVIQKKGSRLVQSGVKNKPVLDYDRAAPWRSKGAIQTIIGKQTWKNLINPILEAAIKRRAQHDVDRKERGSTGRGSPEISEDEEEILNPNPVPKSKEEIKELAGKRRKQRQLEEMKNRRHSQMAVNSTEEEGGEEESTEEEEPPKKKQKRGSRKDKDTDKRGPLGDKD